MNQYNVYGELPYVKEFPVIYKCGFQAAQRNFNATFSIYGGPVMFISTFLLAVLNKAFICLFV